MAASAQHLTEQIQSHHPSLADASAFAATAAFLQALSASASTSASTSGNLTFDPTTLLLKPVLPTSLVQPTDDAGDASPEVRALTQLAADAQHAAFAESHSSALLGAGNEADDMSDVVFWVPATEEAGDEALDTAGGVRTVVRGLGLDGVGEVSEPEPAKVVVPDGVRLTVTGLADSRVIVLEGRRVAGGWAGLIGVGVWS